MKRTRALLAIAAATTLLVTGCSGGSGSGLTKDASGSECTAGGSASEKVAVDGEFGGELELTSKTPVASKKVERTVITEGSGKALEEGDKISATMTTFNGANGEVVQHVPATDLEMAEGTLSGWAYDAMRCAQPEQRVALVVPAADVLGGANPEEAGIADMTKDDSFVVVMDFAKIETCDKTVARDEEYPKVETFDDKAPEIEIPKCMEAPEKLEIDVLKKGDGAVVEPGDEVTVNYRGIIWRTGQEFDSSWSRGEPAKFTTDGVIGGFKEALEGQKVGSTIMSIVPADDGGYGAEQLQQMGHEPDDVMVFVLDIVDTSSAKK